MNATTYKNVTIIDTKNNERTTVDVAPIEGFTRYLAGSDGHVYRLSNYKKKHAVDEAQAKLDELTDGCMIYAWRQVEAQLSNGYMKSDLIDDNGVKHQFLFHRLIASVFIGDIVGFVVDHIDFDRTNNSPENLQIITQKENIWRSIEAGRAPQFRAKHRAE